MRLKVNQLQNIVKQAMNEKKALDVLKKEAVRVLGPIVDHDLDLRSFAKSINERLEVLSRTGRVHSGFDPNAVSAFAHHDNPSVRQMVANLLPEEQLMKFTADKNNAVRATVAKRVSLKTVREMMRAFPNDDQLRLIYRKRSHPKKRLVEGEEFDMYGDKRLGDATRTWEGPELSDDWYITKAYHLVNDYARHGTLEYNWEERAVNAFCDHMRVTSGVVIDKKKLFDAVQDVIKEREDRAMSEPHVHIQEGYNVQEVPGGTFDIVDDTGSIVDSGFENAEDAQQKAEEYEDELNDHYDDDDRFEGYEDEFSNAYDDPANDWKPRVESVLGTCVKNLLKENTPSRKKHDEFLIPEFKEERDSVRELVESGLVGSSYVSRAKQLFNVLESTVPRAIKKHVLGEGFQTRTIPSKARLPHSFGFRSIDEKALDMFVECWNDSQAHQGEPYKLFWNVDPCDANSIGFNVILR